MWKPVRRYTGHHGMASTLVLIPARGPFLRVLWVSRAQLGDSASEAPTAAPADSTVSPAWAWGSGSGGLSLPGSESSLRA